MKTLGLGALNRYAYPLRSLVRRDLRARYAPTALGWLWAVVHPLAHLVLYVFVFALILSIRLPGRESSVEFSLFLMCGYIPFLALAEGVARGASSLTANRDLFSTVLFPAEVLPAIGVITATLGEVIGLALLIVLAAATGSTPSMAILALPMLVLARLCLTLGVAWLVSVLNVFFGDLAESLGLALTALLFMTPIFYPAGMMPDAFSWLLRVNPLYSLVSLYRWSILGMAAPVGAAWLLIFATALSLAAGLWVFRQTIDRAKDVL